MRDCLLGIDAGNTMVKAALFDIAGRELAVCEYEGATQRPRSGFIERSVTELRAGAARAIRDCLARAGVAADRVLAVGAAGHGNGLYALDRAGGALFGIQSLDSRAGALVAGLIESGSAGEIQRLSLQRPWAAATPVLMRWLKQHAGADYGRIDKVLFAKDVIAHFLTGNLGSDYSDAAGAGLIRHPLRRFDRELMALYGLEDALDLLPELHESCAVVGQVTAQAASATGLAAGTPVVAGIFDVVASAIGAGVTQNGEASIVAGSWSINQVICGAPLERRPVFMTSLIERDRYMAIEASATSAANLDWFTREFEGDRSGSGARHCSQLVAGVEPQDDLPIYHPYLYAGRKGTPAKAGFYGLGGWHTKAEMLFALFEGVCLGHRAHIDRLRAAGASFDAATLSGGAARSCVWPQMFADVLGIPIQVSECRETGALGAAICAGVGAGVFTDLADGAAKSARIERRCQPDSGHFALHTRRYLLFKQLETAMEAVWLTMSQR